MSRDPGKLRIRFTAKSILGRAVDPDCVAAVNDAAKLCEKLGHHVEETNPPVNREETTKAFLTIIAADTAAEVMRAGVLTGKPPVPDGFEPGTWFLRQVGRAYTAAELSLAAQYLQRVTRELAAWSQSFDLLLTPTTASPPPTLGTLMPRKGDLTMLAILRALPSGAVLRKALDQLAAEAFEFAAFTMVANVTGQPAMSVPLFWNKEGLPVGAHFVAPYGNEAMLFRLAAQLEKERPWKDRVPPEAAS